MLLGVESRVASSVMLCTCLPYNHRLRTCVARVAAAMRAGPGYVAYGAGMPGEATPTCEANGRCTKASSAANQPRAVDRPVAPSTDYTEVAFQLLDAFPSDAQRNALLVPS